MGENETQAVSYGTYYVGVTNAVERRLQEHQDSLDGKQSYTFHRRPLQLVFQQGFREAGDALAAEKQIKGWRREKKEALIRGDIGLLPALAKKKHFRRS